MTAVLQRRVMSEATGRRLVLAAGFGLLTVCTTLVLKALPEFGLAASGGLVMAVAAAWVILGSQMPALAKA